MTDSTDRVRVEIDDHGVADVALVRSDKMNALDAAMFEAINTTIAKLRDERRVRCIVLHGEGRGFCAGLDMASFAGMGEGAMTDLSARTHGLANSFQHVAWGWRELPMPVIAAVHGVAFGGGLQIALGADIRLTRADAKFSAMEIKWGIVPDMAAFALLAGVIRGDLLRELVYTGRVLSGVEAVEVGLATRVVDDPLAEARALAHQIAAQNPEAVRAAKRLCNLGPGASAAEVLLAEAREQQPLIGSRNQIEAVRAGMARRTPLFED